MITIPPIPILPKGSKRVELLEHGHMIVLRELWRNPYVAPQVQYEVILPDGRFAAVSSANISKPEDVEECPSIWFGMRMHERYGSCFEKSGFDDLPDEAYLLFADLCRPSYTKRRF